MYDLPFPVRTNYAMLLKADGSNIQEAHIVKGLNMPPNKAFIDDTNLIRKQVVQNTLDKLDGLLVPNDFQVCEIQYSRFGQGKIRRDMFFGVWGTARPYAIRGTGEKSRKGFQRNLSLTKA